MDDHVHEWCIAIDKETDFMLVMCQDCVAGMSADEVLRRIRATEVLSADAAKCIHDVLNGELAFEEPDGERLMKYADILEGKDG